MTNSLKGEIIYLSLGSNLGDRMQNLMYARTLFEEQGGRVIKMSRVYQSAAWGFESDNDFYNCCLSATTSLEALALLDLLMKIESSMGRIRKKGGYTDRLIDIDLLFYGDCIMEHPRLTLPHPAMAHRSFVLLPLSEIAGDLIHPVRGQSIREMLETCPGTDQLTRL